MLNLGHISIVVLRLGGMLAGLFFKAAVSTVRHSGLEYGGYIAFLGILSLFPFLIFTTTLVTFFVNYLGVGGDVFSLILLFMGGMPDSVLDGLKPRMQEILSGPSTSIMTLAVINIFWTSSSIIEGLRTVLNISARVEVAPPYILTRMLSIVQFMLISVALTASFILFSVLPLVNDYLLKISLFFRIPAELSIAHRYVGFLIIMGILVWLYRVLPHKKQSLLSIFVASSVVMIIWKLGAEVFIFFVKSFSNVSLIYGGLGSIIISLLFFYMLAVVFIFGAELIYQIESVLGHRIHSR